MPPPGFAECVRATSKSQKREWRVDVSERQHHGERTVEQKFQRMLGEMQILQQSVEHAVASQNRLPGISANQIADAQWNDHQLIEKLFPLSRIKRKVIRQ